MLIYTVKRCRNVAAAILYCTAAVYNGGYVFDTVRILRCYIFNFINTYTARHSPTSAADGNINKIRTHAFKLIAHIKSCRRYHIYKYDYRSNTYYDAKHGEKRAHF